MLIPESISSLQTAQDQKLNDALIHHTKSIKEVQEDLGILNETLSTLRRKSKNGSNKLDLSEAEETIRKACEIFKKIQSNHPLLFNENDVLYPLEKGFKTVEIEEVEKMMDQIANLISQRQNEIPEITQNLKLVTDLNEIITKIIHEMAKEYRRASRSMIDNMIRG